MSEQLLRFKKAFHEFALHTHPHMPQMPQIKLSMISDAFRKINSYDNKYKWMKLFTAGVIIYSGYYYIKHRSNFYKQYSGNKISVVSYFYHLKNLFSQKIYATKNTEKNNVAFEVKELPEHVKYDNGWFNELDELKRSFDSTLETVSVVYNDALTTPLRESTPRGEIIMYYDVETKAFNYYSNSKNIPYSTLDAVARKYVCFHKDASIYIDIREEVQKGREKSLKHDKYNKLKAGISKYKNDILSSAKKSLFAVFKNYKTGRNNYDGKPDVVVIKKNINKFIYKGILEQYDFDLNCYQQNKKRVQNNSDSNVLVEDKNMFEENESTVIDNSDHIHKTSDYIRLKHEKEDLSYVEFKKMHTH